MAYQKVVNMNRYSIAQNSIKDDLVNLGVTKGDILFITIDVLNVGYFEKNRDITLTNWINLLLELVGNKGAIVFAAYTKLFFRFKKKNHCFERFSPTTAGSLPNAVIMHPASIRSSHPSNSVIGIGEVIRPILEKHNSKSMSYSVMGSLIKEPNCKFLMIGTLDKKNAPQAMHYVQEELGHTKLNLYKYLLQTYYVENGVKKLFTKKEFGGCSSGGYKLFSYLVINNAVKFGTVGKAATAIMPAKESYDIIKQVLIKDHKIIKCDNKKCLNCYGNPFNNNFGIISFYFKLLFTVYSYIKKIKK